MTHEYDTPRSVRISDELWAWVVKVAVANGLTASQVVRMALEKAKKEGEK